MLFGSKQLKVNNFFSDWSNFFSMNTTYNKNEKQKDRISRSCALMDLYRATDREKIDEVNRVVRPLIERLVQAIRGDGIRQNDLFAIYPVYYEYNRIQNELNRMVFYAQNSERIQQLQLTLPNVRNDFDQSKNSANSDLYALFQPLLASSDYVLMSSIVVRCLSAAFQYQLENIHSERDKLLRKSQMLTKCDDEQRALLTKFSDLIDKKRISLDVIWRELMLMFNKRPTEHKLVGDKFAEMLFKGQPFEILDGDNFRFNEQFLKTIIEVQKQHQLRIRVISVLGPQNSGKSTLLNFMFGCDFSVSDGRCTRGIYGSFIKATGESAIEFDYLLVLDTEGLQSIEKGDREYDRKLILFAFAVSNIVILNTKDQITDDFKATLEICVDSLSKIEMTRVHRPAVYFVMNQKADPNKRNDQEAINKVIDGFNTNGLITQLRLDDKNFETLPSAFNTYTVDIKRVHELRYCRTSPNFTKRVAAFANTIIEQAIRTEKDDAFSNILSWIRFSNLIFETISNFPDLTYFNTISERNHEKKLQEFLNQKLGSKMSDDVKKTLFTEALITPKDVSENDEKALMNVKQFIVDAKAELIKDLDDYNKTYAVSDQIKNFHQEFLVSQINQIKDSWESELRIKISEASLRREINTGEGKKFPGLI